MGRRCYVCCHKSACSVVFVFAISTRISQCVVNDFVVSKGKKQKAKKKGKKAREKIINDKMKDQPCHVNVMC